MKTAFFTAALLLFAVSPSLATVSVYAKASGSASPLTISGTASSNYAIAGWVIYVDSNLVFRQNTSAGSISQAVSMGSGTHNVVVKAWDSSGANGSASLSVSAGNYSSSGASTSVSTGSGLIPTPPSSAKYFSNIDQMSG